MIHHAYNGLLYAPLFLADELGLLPNDSNLNYTGSDEDCLKALCSNDNKVQNWFAICDPSSVEDINRYVPQGDDLCVIGCLVNKLPVWAVNKNSNVYHVRNECELKRYDNILQTICCYPEGTTGHLIGKRLNQDIFKRSKIEPKPFGEEFYNLKNNKILVLTSDIFHIVRYDRDDHNDIVFDYTLDSPQELSPFLFTGILTLKDKVLDENLWAAVNLLTGIKRAIQLLKRSPDRETYIDILLREPRNSREFGKARESYRTQLKKMGVMGEKDQKEIIKNSLDFIFEDKRRIYNEDLMPDSIAWDKAQRQWESIEGRQKVSTQIKEEPIPSLLIQRGWRADIKLHKAIKLCNNAVPISSKKVFVVHGHNVDARDAIEKYLEDLDLEPITIAKQPHEGQTIIDKFTSNADVAFAIVLLTSDDNCTENHNGSSPRLRARQNVIFELGFFLGRLDKKNVAMLIKGDIEKPSDIEGIGFTVMEDNGAWKSKLADEMKAAGLNIDKNKIKI